VAALGLFALLTAPGTAFAQESVFPDVNASMPSFEAIGFLSGAGIISGYASGDFGPSDTLKRGQATKMLVLWQQLPLLENQASFPDLDDVYRSYIETACAQGWITGFPDGRFKPYSTLTRQQMAIIMVRAMGWEDVAKNLSQAEADQILSVFVDQADIADVARPYTAVAVSEGLFGGDGQGRLNPRAGITRAQFCLVVFRAELAIRSVITDVRSAVDWPDRTRVVFDLSRAPDSVTASTLSDGILMVDYAGGAISGKLEKTIDGSAEIQSVSAIQLAYQPRTVRIVIDMGRYSGFRVMSLAPSEGKGYRIAVDVFRRSDGPDGDGPPLVFIDPGHGGTATGAIGTTGVLEKDLNLSISLMLADNLRKAGLKVMMSRETDCAVDLHARGEMANSAKANLFVCVHNNAGAEGDGEANGTETYYFNSSGNGRLLAQIIQRNLVAALGSFDRGVKSAEFAVLVDTKMPAALVEVGFLSNVAEEARLVTPAYQRLAADAIAKGVLEYLKWSTTVYSSEL
jgi:N-acetylmuramoyl-L-alanine amidase